MTLYCGVESLECHRLPFVLSRRTPSAILQKDDDFHIFKRSHAVLCLPATTFTALKSKSISKSEHMHEADTLLRIWEMSSCVGCQLKMDFLLATPGSS